MKLTVMIDGTMINKFIEHSDEFDKYAEENYKQINQSQENNNKVAESIAMDCEESHDDDGFTAVDLESYKSQLKEMMKAVAIGIGNTPVNVLVDEGSLLLKINEFEIARIEKENEELEEKMKNQKKVEDDEEEEVGERKREINGNGSLKKIGVDVTKKSNKKKNNILNLGCCSGKQFVKDH